MKPTVSGPDLLIASRDLALYDAVKGAAEPERFRVSFCQPDDDLLGLVRENDVRAVLIDVAGACRDAFPLLRRLKKHDPRLDVLVAGEPVDADTVLSLIHQGATDFIPKPLEIEAVRIALRRITEDRAIRRATFRLEKKLERNYMFQNMVSRNPYMLEIFGLIRNIARHFATVLVTGETGTGKEMIARAIHDLSPRRDRPLVVCDCASVPESLFESELFGYRRGAFTGADRDKPGLFEEADGGILFLDEIAEIPAAVQSKLLRVLETRQFRPLGAQAVREVDTRIIAATNRDLAQSIRTGTFREDLYHRLNRIEIALPPLRERLEDIPLLARHFLHRAGRKYGKSLRGLSREAQKLFIKYDWPGNVRELANVVENAALLGKKDFVDVANLPKYLRDYAPAAPPIPLLRPEKPATLEDLEREYIGYLLKTTKRNLRQTARILGISRTTLYNKIRKYDIPLEGKRPAAGPSGAAAGPRTLAAGLGAAAAKGSAPATPPDK